MRLLLQLVLLITALTQLTTAATAAESAVIGTRGMVVTPQHEASAVGRDILAAGGNAIDAAVAVGYALAVVDPCCGNIGGGGFMLIRFADGRRRFIDFRETAPKAASRDMYLDESGKPRRDQSLYGYLAVGVPGTVAGLDHALTAYGKLNRAAVMAPAIRLARSGFVLGDGDVALISGKADKLAEDPAARAVFLRPDGSRYRVGDRLMQADLGATLALIAEHGPDAFYRGPIATALTAASARHGGMLTEPDFSDYRVKEREPVACAYRGYDVISSPPPSSGGTILCEMLNILSGWDMRALPFRSVRQVHLMTETMRLAYRDRNSELGDPDFVTNPIEGLLSPEYAASLREAVDIDKATSSATLSGIPTTREKAETTHYSVVDAEGNAVAVTYTINGNFGAAVMAPGTGFLLNNEMDDFTVKPGSPNLFGLVQGEANTIAPGKRPLSSMTPTIVEKDGKPVLVLGSPGGPRIITAVLETLTNIIDSGLGPAEAVVAPRFHHQFLPDTLYYERGGLSQQTITGLTAMGHHLTEQSRWSAVELIAIGPDGKRYGVSDPRRAAGAAIGN